MPTLSGQATQQQVQDIQALLDYDKAEISLYTNTNDSQTSGGTLSGSGTYSWSFSWDNISGFSGIDWYVTRFLDYTNEMKKYSDDGIIDEAEAAEIYDILSERQVDIGIALGAQVHPCATRIDL